MLRRRVERIVRVVARSRRHGRRAIDAIRRAGPGRHPGSVTTVEVDGTSVVVAGVVQVADVVESVVVTVDGRPVAVAAVARPVVPSDGGDCPSTSTWQAVIPRTVVGDGVRSVGALAVGRSGLTEALDGRRAELGTTGAASEPSGGSAPVIHGLVDLPHEGSIERGGVIEVAGWVLPALAIDRVEVTVDDGDPEPARLFCMPRQDLPGLFSDPTSVLGGFWHLVDTGAVVDERPVTVRVEAVGAGGRRLLGTRRITTGADPDGPAPGDGRWVASLDARSRLAAAAHVPDAGVNVAVFVHHLGLGGAQLWLQEILAALLTDVDVACTVIAPADGPLRGPLEAAGARVHLCGDLPGESGRYESMVRELVAVLAADGCNVALVNTAGAFIGVDVAGRCGIPSIWAIHEHYPPNEYWHNAFGRDVIDAHVRARGMAALTEATARCFVSDATRAVWTAGNEDGPERDLVVDYGIPADRIARAQETLDRATLRAAHGFGPDDQVLIGVATFEPRKAQSNLLLAFARLAEDHPDAHLVLIGSRDDDYSRSVAVLADALDLGRRARCVPLTADVDPWYAMADGFVLASDVESFPRVVLEAVAHEVPVVTTDVGGVGELVRDGDTGIVCAGRDIAALAEAMRRLLTMPATERQAMVARATAELGRRSDGLEYADRFVALVRGLAKDPGASPRSLLAPPPARG